MYFLLCQQIEKKKKKKKKKKKTDSFITKACQHFYAAK